MTLRKYHIICILLSLLIGLHACKGRKKSTASAPFKLESTENALRASESNWNYYSAKAKVEVSGGGIEKSVDAVIKMRKDSVVWISLGLFGFEGMRIFMHKDSITILNKLDKSYSKLSWKKASDYVGADLNLSKTQSLLVGNLLMPIDSLYQLNQDSALYFIQRVTIASMYKVRLDSFTKELAFSYFRGAKTGKSMTLNYNKYDDMDSIRLPYMIKLSAKDGLSKFSGNISINSIDIEPFGILPTRVPASFERK